MENLLLVVGLGNPGRKYEKTRHNAGFMLVERLAQKAAADWQDDKRSKSRVAKASFGGRRAILCQPQTYMNCSGEAVRSLADFYRIPSEDVLVVVDDADIPLGSVRMRPGGSSGGHNGLKSIEAHLGGKKFARQRIGIGRRDGSREIVGHVLGRFDAEEMKILELALARAADQAECWLTAGIEKAMNEHNGAVIAPNDAKEQQ